MSVAELDELRAAVVENAISLIDDADLLYVNARYPRAYALSVLAIEEVSKLPALISCLEQLANGAQPDWDDIDEFLNSHHGKLLMNQLYWASQRTPGGLDATDTRQWEDAVKAARDIQGRKLSSLYGIWLPGQLTEALTG